MLYKRGLGELHEKWVFQIFCKEKWKCMTFMLSAVRLDSGDNDETTTIRSCFYTSHFSDKKYIRSIFLFDSTWLGRLGDIRSCEYLKWHSLAPQVPPLLKILNICKYSFFIMMTNWAHYESFTTAKAKRQ